MESFLRFLLRFRSLLLFLVLEAVAVVLMINTSNYHHYVIFSSANAVSGNLLGAVWNISDYFSLKQQNYVLSEQNTALMEYIRDLETRIESGSYANADSSVASLDTLVSPDRAYRLVGAKVVNASVNKRLNYITLNKGRSDGIDDNMGVICPDGVVGTIAMVSEKFSLVLPVLNIQAKTSCRLDSSNCFGSLQWDGGSPLYAELEEIPRHIQVRKGETVSTSGFSDIFPAGIPVGRVDSVSLQPADNFYRIRVRLSTDFNCLNYVQVVSFADTKELVNLTDSINRLND